MFSKTSLLMCVCAGLLVAHADAAKATKPHTKGGEDDDNDNCSFVSVETDAAYCVPSPCGDEGDDCPQKGATTVLDCHKALSSWNETNQWCVLQRDTVCTKLAGSNARGCIFPDTESDAIPETEAPPTADVTTTAPTTAAVTTNAPTKPAPRNETDAIETALPVTTVSPNKTASSNETDAFTEEQPATPTTLPVTTIAPKATTAEPTTAEPTTAEPTTAGPTTVEPIPAARLRKALKKSKRQAKHLLAMPKAHVKDTPDEEKCTLVSVVGDAAYCVKGSVCSGAIGVCPSKGAETLVDCHDALSSWDNENKKCVLPRGTSCQPIADSTAFGCFLDDVKATTPRPSTIESDAIPEKEVPTTAAVTTAAPNKTASSNETEAFEDKTETPTSLPVTTIAPKATTAEPTTAEPTTVEPTTAEPTKATRRKGVQADSDAETVAPPTADVTTSAPNKTASTNETEAFAETALPVTTVSPNKTASSNETDAFTDEPEAPTSLPVTTIAPKATTAEPTTAEPTTAEPTTVEPTKATRLKSSFQHAWDVQEDALRGNVSVSADATWEVASPVCGDLGSNCPKAGDETTIDCHKGLASFNATTQTCIAWSDAACLSFNAIVDDKTTTVFGCFFTDLPVVHEDGNFTEPVDTTTTEPVVTNATEAVVMSAAAAHGRDHSEAAMNQVAMGAAATALVVALAAAVIASKSIRAPASEPTNTTQEPTEDNAESDDDSNVEIIEC